MKDVRAPVLVTGAHRSGTTWVGHMLTLSGDAHYVHEPFAPMNHRSWLTHQPRIRFLHQDPAVPGPYANDLARIAALRPCWGPILRRAAEVRDVVRLGQDMWATGGARRRGAKAVIKDPFAFLSAEWIARQSDARVIVLVRHPAAFVSSVVRLGWRLDERWLLDQGDLMRGDLQGFRDNLERSRDQDLVGHAATLWRALTTVASRYRRDHPDWVVMRYEDLALDPVVRFRDLYKHCEIDWSVSIAEEIAARNAPDNVVEVAPGSKGGTKRDSRSAIWTWRDRLAAQDIRRVREVTADVAADWYEDEAWWNPGHHDSAP